MPCTGVVSTELQSPNQQLRVCSTLCSGSLKEPSTSSELQPAMLQELDRPAKRPSAALLLIHAVSLTGFGLFGSVFKIRFILLFEIYVSLSAVIVSIMERDRFGI